MAAGTRIGAKEIAAKYFGTKEISQEVCNGVVVYENAVQQTVDGSLPQVLPNAVSKSLVSLTRYGKVEQRNLPQGYTEVEYLQTDGNSYIDTGVLLSNTDVFEITFQSPNTLSTAIMGAISGGADYTSTDNLCVTYTIMTALSDYAVYCDGAAGNANYSWNGGNRADGQKHTIKYNGLNVAPTLDGVAMTQVQSHTLIENTPTVTTWLFGRNNTSTGALAQSGVRIFDVNIQGKGHFIPAKRNSDNVLGMYDLVSGAFLTNAGTGAFTAGSALTPTFDRPVDLWVNTGKLVWRDDDLPKGYRRLKGIRFNNDIYYEILGFKLRGSDTIRFRFKTPTAAEGGTACNLLGAYDGTSANTNLSLYIGDNAAARYLRYDGETYSSQVVFGDTYNVVISPTGCTGLEQTSTWTEKTFESVVNLHIGITSGLATSAKFIGDLLGNIEVENRGCFIPCERASDGVLGYYDIYSETFYEPTGTGGESLGYEWNYSQVTTEPREPRKNKFTTQGKISSWGCGLTDDGAQVDRNNSYISSFLPVLPNTTYTFSCKRFANNYEVPIVACLYNSSRQFVALAFKNTTYAIGDIVETFTTGATAAFIRVSWSPSDDGYFQLEAGSEATAYERYNTQEQLTVKGGALPDGYTQLAYLGSNGTQYLDLGYKGNGNTKAEVKFKYNTASSATGSGRVFGSRGTATNNAFAIGTSSGVVASTETNKLFWCYDGQPFYVDSGEFGLDVWKTVVFSATEHTIDGVSVGDDYTQTEFETPTNLKLFGFDQTSGGMGVGYVDVEYCKLWDNGVLVRNLVPAKNDVNVVGMYDLVSDTFLTNAGTGDFAAGPVALPAYPEYNAEVRLLAAVGEYKDTHELVGGQGNNAVEELALDGTEDWSLSSNAAIAYFPIWFGVAGDASLRIALPCTHLVGTAEINADMPNYSIKMSVSADQPSVSKIWIKLDGNAINLTALKAKLAALKTAGTPVIVVAPRNNPSSYNYEAQTLKTVKGANRVSTDSLVPPADATITYKKKGGS